MDAPHVTQNPFYVLELGLQCGAVEVERQGKKLLGMLELGLAQARTYPTPLGPQPRDASLVRHAMSELREPNKRLAHEVWARLPATPLRRAGDEPTEPNAAAELERNPAEPSELRRRLGWG